MPPVTITALLTAFAVHKKLPINCPNAITGNCPVFLNEVDLHIIFELAQGYNARKASHRLNMAYSTFNNHIFIMYENTDCKTHAELVQFANRHTILFYEEGVLMIKMTEENCDRIGK